MMTAAVALTSIPYPVILFLTIWSCVITRAVADRAMHNMQQSMKHVATRSGRTWHREACFCLHKNPSILNKRILNFKSFASTAENNNDTNTQQTKTFYQRINQPRHILAPMVAQSDLPFRLMCEQLYNVDLSYTQMIHAHNFAERGGDTFRRNHLDVYDESLVRNVLLGSADSNALIFTQSQRNALEGLSESDIEASRQRIISALQTKNNSLETTFEVKPCVVQIAAHDPDMAAKAAEIILERSNGQCLAIDLNLGCPQAIARKGRYGSFLHDETPQAAYDVLTKLRNTLPKEVGVTAKIRLPPTQADAQEGKLGHEFRFDNPVTIEERVRRLIDSGVDLITIHGRTRFENKVTVGPVNWDGVRLAAATAREYSGDVNFPIFANGGIEYFSDVQKCFDETLCSGVMSSESLLENPGIFDEQNIVSGRDTLERQLQYADTYLDYCTIFPPLPGSLGIKGGSYNVAKSHLFKILHRYLEEQPDLRTWLGNQECCTILQARALMCDLRSRYSALDEEQLKMKTSWKDDNSWYRRHRQSNASAAENTEPVSLEERKKLAKLRIQALREQRLSRA
ncbi:tRNA-dihydrouridine synthase family protein [Skeletonema marinoi]|uniref:tRNA-dihydrouridine(16/17) synthase [NAD(P)(+)] n=1 Tax=Skeletonema marinoi TaxID=267567 RepID=A0AAD8YMD0_9STRA|nr:tRNA-dihydrouridine synthase family protein [Skeletonema marinoi]